MSAGQQRQQMQFELRGSCSCGASTANNRLENETFAFAAVAVAVTFNMIPTRLSGPQVSSLSTMKVDARGRLSTVRRLAAEGNSSSSTSGGGGGSNPLTWQQLLTATLGAIQHNAPFIFILDRLILDMAS